MENRCDAIDLRLVLITALRTGVSVIGARRHGLSRGGMSTKARSFLDIRTTNATQLETPPAQGTRQMRLCCHFPDPAQQNCARRGDAHRIRLMEQGT